MKKKRGFVIILGRRREEKRGKSRVKEANATRDVNESLQEILFLLILLSQTFFFKKKAVPLRVYNCDRLSSVVPHLFKFSLPQCNLVLKPHLPLSPLTKDQHFLYHCSNGQDVH